MSFSYDRYDRRQSSSSRRTAFGYWVPLVLTATVATAGFAAWVWSERREDDDSDDADLSYGEDGDGRMPEPARSSRDSMSQGVVRDDEGIVGRMQGVIRRTPSPQQLFDSVSKKTAAGIAAAGAAAGAALASIREEDRDDYADHNRWTEEAEIKRNVEAQSAQSQTAVDRQAKSFAESVRGGPSAGARRKTVAIVVSAESLMDNLHEDDSSYRSENAVSPNWKAAVPDNSFTTDHTLPPPRHRLLQNKTLRPCLLAFPPLSSKLSYRCRLPRLLVLRHLYARPHSRRRTPIHRSPLRRHRLHTRALSPQLR